MRIIQPGQHRRLAAEHLREPRISQQLLPQVLDRHQGPRPVMPGQHHLTETTRTQRSQPGVPRNTPAGHACLPDAAPGIGHLAGDHRVITHR